MAFVVSSSCVRLPGTASTSTTTPASSSIKTLVEFARCGDPFGSAVQRAACAVSETLLPGDFDVPSSSLAGLALCKPPRYRRKDWARSCRSCGTRQPTTPRVRLALAPIARVRG